MDGFVQALKGAIGFTPGQARNLRDGEPEALVLVSRHADLDRAFGDFIARIRNPPRKLERTRRKRADRKRSTTRRLPYIGKRALVVLRLLLVGTEPQAGNKLSDDHCLRLSLCCRSMSARMSSTALAL